MLSNIKYEFYKLLSVRSTYIATLISLFFSGLIVVSHLVEYDKVPGDLKSNSIAAVMLDTPVAAALIAAVVGMLFVVHEYRYNTIMYTLAASRSRAKVLLAKVLAVVTYAVVLGALCVGLGVLAFRIGLAISGEEIPAQTFDVLTTFTRCIGYVLGMALIGMLFATLTRNIIFAIVALFMLPAVAEPLLGIFLKNNIAYLPFTALTQLVMPVNAPDQLLSPAKGALVFCAYLIVGWIVALILFLRRDAN